jgi:hypothetical protein
VLLGIRAFRYRRFSVEALFGIRAFGYTRLWVVTPFQRLQLLRLWTPTILLLLEKLELKNQQSLIGSTEKNSGLKKLDFFRFK